MIGIVTNLHAIAAELLPIVVGTGEMIGIILLTGDRFSCCDEAVVWCDDETLSPVGIATIAPRGEENEGQPTIVGVYVRPEWRRQGIGIKLFTAAVERMQKRQLPHPYRVDIVSKSGKALIARCPENIRALLDIHDSSRWSFF